MSKKGKSKSNNKKQEEESDTNQEKSLQTNSEESRDNSNSSRTRKKYLIRKFILKNKNCISYGLHTRIFKVTTFKYKGKKFFLEY